MTFFFVFRLAFSTYPCCWKENWKKFKKAALDPLFLERYLYGNRGSRKDFSKKIKKIWTIWGFFGKILVWSDPGKLQASRKKNRKKSEKKAPLTAFWERYLFGTIREKYRLPERKIKKSQKKSDDFQIFLEDTWWRQRCINDGNDNFFAKKFKKIPPMGRFLERYLFWDDQDFCRIVKKLKKSSKFFGHFWFFLEDTFTRAEKRDQQYFPCREGKKWEKWKKIRPLSDFRRRYLFGAIRWQL